MKQEDDMDETGVFFKALPVSGFGAKGKECKEGKKSKYHYTIAFFFTATEKMKIRKSEMPCTSPIISLLKLFLPSSYSDSTSCWNRHIHYTAKTKV